jgi:hypothetical protein
MTTAAEEEATMPQALTMPLLQTVRRCVAPLPLGLLWLALAGPAAQAAGPARPAAAGRVDSVTLGFQQLAQVPASGLSIQFVGYRDNRCPSDVTCAWAGEAQAHVWVTGTGFKPRLLTLAWDGGMRPERFTVHMGAHGFYLQSLEPRPLSAGSVNPADYKAVLKVTH